MSGTTVATAEHGVVAHTDTHDPHGTNTGVSHTKLAIWLFLSSEAFFFGAFIATYFLYRGRDAQYLGGPTPTEVFNIPFTSVTSFILNSQRRSPVFGSTAWIDPYPSCGRRVFVAPPTIGGSAIVGNVPVKNWPSVNCTEFGPGVFR